MIALPSTKFLQATAGIILATVLLVPLYIHAQATNSDLSATIRAAILKDPRSASLTPTQIDAMVSALSTQAQSQGVSAQAIAYQPGTAGIAVPQTVAATAPSPASDACSLSTACSIGRYLSGGVIRNWIYVSFWILAGILIIVVSLMRRNPHTNGSIEKPEIPAIGSLGR